MASSPSPPKPVDPNTIIQAQEQANRVNRITPFGSQTYDAKGNLTTTLPQGTQNAFNNITDMAGNKQQFVGGSNLGGLQDAIMNKIGARYGMGGSGGSPQKSGPQSMGTPGLSANGAPNPAAWQGVLGQMFGGGMGGGGMPSMPPQGGMQMPSFAPPPQSGMPVTLPQQGPQ